MNPVHEGRATTVRIERLVAGGDGLARDEDGRIVFVRGALPDELVTAAVVHEHRDVAHAVVVEVVEPSPDRRAPPCRHRLDGCGGCDWMHLSPAAQLPAKVEVVKESLRRVAKLPADDVERLVVAGQSVPEVGTRTTVRVVGSVDGRAGFRMRASNDVVAVSACMIARPELSDAIGALRIEPGDEVELRYSPATGEIARGPARSAIVQQVGSSLLQVSSGAFFQSSPEGAALLADAVSRMLPELPDARVAVDAYGGGGLFSAVVLAPTMRQGMIVLVESNRAACADAEVNLRAAIAGRDGVRHRVVRADFGRWRPDRAVDVIVADPARAGLGKLGVATVQRAQPNVVALVSCDPVAMARDVGLLRPAAGGSGGYRLAAVEVIDLFPNTHHVETVARLERVDAADG
jgi:23S rRNA (uracil1939-C5)-methyltransferase